MEPRRAQPLLVLDAASLEDWQPGQADVLWREVEVLDRYLFDGRSRVSVRLLEGPESGRTVTGLSPTQVYRADDLPYGSHSPTNDRRAT